MNIKKKNLFKKMLIFSSLTLILISVFVGNFFVNYALMPGKGGENRKIKKADTKQKEEMYAAKTKGMKDIFMVKGVGHAQAYLLNPNEYYSRIFTFIKNIK